MSDHDDIIATGLDALLDVHPMAQSKVAVTAVVDAVEPDIRLDERKKIAATLRTRAKDAMVSARSAALHEAWATAAGFRVQATTMREIASELEEME